MNTNLYIYIYIHIERDVTYCVSVYVFVYIYIYLQATASAADLSGCALGLDLVAFSVRFAASCLGCWRLGGPEAWQPVAACGGNLWPL